MPTCALTGTASCFRALSVNVSAVRYAFGEYVLDTRAYSLSRAGAPIAVRPKVFDVLRYLIEHRTRVVAKQELLDALWREPFVDAFAVPWTVSHVRRALDQGRASQQPILTVRGRGYRFVAETTESESDALPALASTPATNHVDPELAAAAAAESAGAPFIGRDALMGQLSERLARAALGSGSFCLLVGDAGLGKTRCMEELSQRAQLRGFSIWSGRSFEATCNPVFWPWIQILHQLAEEYPAEADAARALETQLSLDSQAETLDARASSDRYWHYEALVTLLRKASRAKPLLLSFDDLHWADQGTSDLLSYLGPELRRLAILTIGARREKKGQKARARSLPQLRDADRFKLSALNLADVADYLRVLDPGAAQNAELCALAHSLSAGNPWFLRETVDGLIVDHGRAALATLAASEVRVLGAASEQLRMRCLALEPDVRRILELAAVLGDRFEVELVARMADRALGEVLEALEIAHDAGLISLAPQRALFAHDLVREVLYEGIELGARLRLHLRAARELERAFDPLRLGEVAHHYHAALPLAPAQPAAAAAVRAAEAAARAKAFGDAANFLEWASEAQLNERKGDPRARAELLLRRATMARFAGQEAAARSSVGQLIELGREHGYADLLVAAAGVLRASVALAVLPDAQAHEALEQALALTARKLCEERASALSLSSWSLPHALDMSRSKALSGEALSMARQLKSQRALHDALHARIYALSGPDDIDALLCVADELLSLPGERPAWLAGEALFASYRAHLYRCDTAKADACLRDLGREAQLQGLSEALYHHDFFLAQRAFSRGEFAESEQSFEELSARGARLNLWQAPILHSVAKMLLVNEREGMSAVAKAQGLDAMLAGLVTLPPCYAATGARLAAEAGRLELARELLHQLTQHDFQRVVKDLGYVNALTNLALVAIELDDRAQARAIFERLAPYPGHNTPSGAIGFYEGAAARFLAALAAFLGEPESLVCRYYDDALTLNEQLGALPLVARTAYEYARFLFKCERKTVADALQRRALELAERFGMHALAQQTRAL